MSTASMGRAVEILLVDNDPADVRLTLQALKRSKLYARMSVVSDGAEALAILRRQGKYAGAARPDLILLDLDLPDKNAREVLTEIKQDRELKHIPVAIFTSANHDPEKLKACQALANCCVTKPLGLEQFLTVVRSVESFWFTIVQLSAG